MEEGGKGENERINWHSMMLLERWLIAAVVGLTVPLVSVAGGVSGQEQSGNPPSQQPSKTGNAHDPVPAKAVVDPNEPPPDDPQAQAPKKDDDLAPEPDADAQGDPETKTAQPKTAVTKSAVPSPPVVGKDDMPAETKGAVPAVKASGAAGDENTGEPRLPQTDQKKLTTDVAKSGTQQPMTHGKYDKETVQLLSLVQDLKAEVDKAGANTLSLAALRKADEVQRLAKDLKEKMRVQGQAVAGRP